MLGPVRGNTRTRGDAGDAGAADGVADPDTAEPRRTAIRPASTDSRGTADPWSNTLIAVTFPAPSRPNVSRSRVRTVPESIRTYATFSPPDHGRS